MAQEYENFRAVLLGAGEWPGLQATKASGVFERSKNAFKSYLTDVLGMQPGVQILDLFGSQDSPTDIDRTIREFLQEHVEDDELNFTHLIVYYTGHGGFTDRDHSFQLMLPYTTDEQRNSSGYKVSMIAETINDKARQATKLVILDCCFAAGALPDMMRLSDGELDEKIGAEARAHFPSASGTALLAASNQKQWALAEDKDGMMTMFSSGLISALNEGGEEFDPLLSLSDVEKLCTSHIADTYLEEAVIPQLHVPHGLRAEIAEVALLPNPARKPPSVDERLDALEAKFEGVVSSLRSQTAEISTQFKTLAERLDQGDVGAQQGSVGNQYAEDTASDFGPWNSYRMSRADWTLLEFDLQQYLTKHLQAGRLARIVCLTAFGVFCANFALSNFSIDYLSGIGFKSLWLDTISVVTFVFAVAVIVFFLLGLLIRGGASTEESLLEQLEPEDKLRLDRLDHRVMSALMNRHYDPFGIPIRLPWFFVAVLLLVAAIAFNFATFNFYADFLSWLFPPSHDIMPAPA